MGKRRQPRKEVRLPVRIFGTDAAGALFSSNVFTVNVSRTGVELSGVQTKLAIGEMIGLSYLSSRAHFRVKWIGTPGTPGAQHVGLLNTSPEKPLWDFPLPADQPDQYQPGSDDRRQHPRFRCQNAVELIVEPGVILWGSLADLSLGGCYVEMAAPLPPGTHAKIGIWCGSVKTMSEVKIVHSTRGVGFGLIFLDMSESDREVIRRFLGTLSPFARKPAQSTLSGS